MKRETLVAISRRGVCALGAFVLLIGTSATLAQSPATPADKSATKAPSTPTATQSSSIIIVAKSRSVSPVAFMESMLFIMPIMELRMSPTGAMPGVPDIESFLSDQSHYPRAATHRLQREMSRVEFELAFGAYRLPAARR